MQQAGKVFVRILTQMTWAEIKVSPRHQYGTEVIKELQDKLPCDARAGSPAIAIRFCDKAPMVGFREDDTFYVVWFDRAFKLYKH